MRQDTVRASSGVIGNNIGVNTTICQVENPGTGRYKIWGTVRHTLEDGCKLIVAAALILPRIPQTAAQTVHFGPIVIDLNAVTDDIVLQLAVATGGSDTAAGAIYVEEINQ